MNEGLAVSASVPQPAIVITPAIGTLRQAAMASESARISAADHPCLDSSPDVLTCKQTAGGLDTSRASVSSSCKSLSDASARPERCAAAAIRPRTDTTFWRIRSLVLLKYARSIKPRLARQPRG